MKCTGMQMVSQQCPHDAIWRNGNGVEVCELHKSLLDAFTWENRNERKWHKINTEDDNPLARIWSEDGTSGMATGANKPC